MPPDRGFAHHRRRHVRIAVFRADVQQLDVGEVGLVDAARQVRVGDQDVHARQPRDRGLGGEELDQCGEAAAHVLGPAQAQVERAVDGRHRLGVAHLEGGEERLLLVFEVLVEGLQGDRGFGDDLLEAERRIALARGQVGDRVEDPFALVVRDVALGQAVLSARQAARRPAWRRAPGCPARVLPAGAPLGRGRGCSGISGGRRIEGERSRRPRRASASAVRSSASGWSVRGARASRGSCATRRRSRGLPAAGTEPSAGACSKTATKKALSISASRAQRSMPTGPAAPISTDIRRAASGRSLEASNSARTIASICCVHSSSGS